MIMVGSILNTLGKSSLGRNMLGKNTLGGKDRFLSRFFQVWGRRQVRVWIFAILFSFCGGILNFKTASARVTRKDVLIVGTTSLYGMAAGTVLGLASLPAHQSVRGVFQGTSLGLYIGIIVGLYHLQHQDDPENPLRLSQSSFSGSGHQSRMEDEVAAISASSGYPLSPQLSPKEVPLVEIAYPVFQF
jgi:hypothetical protein